MWHDAQHSPIFDLIYSLVLVHCALYTMVNSTLGLFFLMLCLFYGFGNVIIHVIVKTFLPWWSPLFISNKNWAMQWFTISLSLAKWLLGQKTLRTQKLKFTLPVLCVSWRSAVRVYECISLCYAYIVSSQAIVLCHVQHFSRSGGCIEKVLDDSRLTDFCWCCFKTQELNQWTRTTLSIHKKCATEFW